MTIRSLVMFLAMVAWGPFAAAQGQTYTCLPASAWAAYSLRDYMIRLVTATDTELVATRILYQLPVVAATEVIVDSSSAICNRAGAAYHSAVAVEGTPPTSRTLAVVRVGKTRFVVLDPKQMAGEFEIHVIFDSKWNRLAAFIG
jgi:hypothetical protein